MNYNLNVDAPGGKTPVYKGLMELLRAGASEKWGLIGSAIILLLNTGISLMGPLIIAHAIDHYIQEKDFDGLLIIAAGLLLLYLIVFGSGYAQARIMGGVGQRMIFRLRNGMFQKIQELPVAFFNQNKAGDLISRVHADAERLNQFFSQSLLQFLSSVVTLMVSAGFLLGIHWKLGLLSMLPVLCIWACVYWLSPWIKGQNANSMNSYGALFGEIQEGLHNFKLIIAFNKRDYYRMRFDGANQNNYQAAVKAGLANTVFVPVFGLFSHLAQLLVLVYGVVLIREGTLSVGLLIGYMAYVTTFYNPIRQLAGLWASLQSALATWERISKLMAMENDLKVIDAAEEKGN